MTTGNTDVCQLSYYFHMERMETPNQAAGTPTSYQVVSFSFTRLALCQ